MKYQLSGLIGPGSAERINMRLLLQDLVLKCLLLLMVSQEIILLCLGDYYYDDPLGEYVIRLGIVLLCLGDYCCEAPLGEYVTRMGIVS